MKGVASFAPIYLLVRIGVAEPVMGLLLAVAAGGQLVFLPLVGRLADRGNRKRLIVAGTVMSDGFALSLAVAAVLASRPAQLLVAGGGFLLMSGGFAALEIGTTSLLGDLVSETHEIAFLGLQSTTQGIGGIIGPTLVGAMVVLVGYEQAFAAVSLLAFIAMALIGIKLDESVRTGAPEPGVYAIETASGIPRPTDTFVTKPVDEREAPRR